MLKSIIVVMACVLAAASCDGPAQESDVKYCYYEVVSITFDKCTGTCDYYRGKEFQDATEECKVIADCYPTDTKSSQCSESRKGACTASLEVSDCR